MGEMATKGAADEDVDAILEQVVSNVVEVFQGLDPDERAEVLSALLERFCSECGEDVSKSPDHDCMDDDESDDGDEDEDDDDEDGGGEEP